MLQGNAIIGQSGGPTSVINASLVGIIHAAVECEGIKSVLGMRYGIEGFLEEDIIDLGAESPRNLEQIKNTPSSALGSCRLKLQDHHLPDVLELLKKHQIHYLFLIGGNDTMDTIHRVEAYAKAHDYPLVGIGIAKTVDNDLFGTDHTPGFASAARYMALSIQQAGTLARDMQRVDQFVVFQCIGREAGWLVGATAAGKKLESDAPHLMCFPERAFDRTKFIADVKRCHQQYGFVSIVCGEGITHADWLAKMAENYPEKLAIGIDARHGLVATDGWQQVSKLTADEFALSISQMPIGAIIYTDILKDGMMAGPNFEAVKKFNAHVDVPVIASGGVTTIEDVSMLSSFAISGCIVGRSLYEGKMELHDALSAARNNPQSPV
ncbi:diphosphate--fructose-6-phosphate 1-phosphotransferase [Pirellulaceae bacterium]|nr:diphosphate--fructose-6-phosphate 1-phosphotransferase [Pirellulaceae bacterium]